MFRRQQSSCTGAIFNHESAAWNSLTQLGGKQARHNVIGASGSKTHHNAHLARGPGLRMGTACNHANQRWRRQQSAAAMNARHGPVSSGLFSCDKAKPARTCSASLGPQGLKASPLRIRLP
jgi:hypothetical protein